MKPISNRSTLRMFLGRKYFTWKRKQLWKKQNEHFSKISSPEPLPHLIFDHQSPLLRKLKNVDLQLQKNKIRNLELAISKINRIVLKPGQIFSFWYLVGAPHKRKGYLEGMVLHNGKIKTEIGGGLCQLTNLIFWMTLHTPLTVMERWRHSHDVFPDENRTLPFGSGATCAYNYIDLQIKNETNQTFQLWLELDSTHLKGKWLSDRVVNQKYKIEERNHQIIHEMWGGYTRHNELFQIIFDANTEKKLGDKKVVENHCIMMYEPMLKSGV